jgi:prefoldin subunit 5
MREFEVIDNWTKEVEEQYNRLHKRYIELEKNIEELSAEEKKLEDKWRHLNQNIRFCEILEKSLDLDRSFDNNHTYYNVENNNRRDAIKFLKNELQSKSQIKYNELKAVEEKLEYLKKEYEVVKAKMSSYSSLLNYLNPVNNTLNKIMLNQEDF